MTKLPVDTLIQWLEHYTDPFHDEHKAIRTILEQHRDSPSGWIPAALMETEKREAIRAFVERVEKRVYDSPTWNNAGDVLRAFQDELAALEKEATK